MKESVGQDARRSYKAVKITIPFFIEGYTNSEAALLLTSCRLGSGSSADRLGSSLSSCSGHVSEELERIVSVMSGPASS